MAATFEDIKGWLKRGKEKGATHVIVVCDTYDYDDYPVYVLPNENVHEVERNTMVTCRELWKYIICLWI